MNIILLMAGAGSRFQGKYSLPKPLIQLQNRCLFQWASDSINLDCNRIFIVRQEHIDQYYLDHTIEYYYPSSMIIAVEQITGGQACSAFLAASYVNDDQPLFILNCDHYVEWKIDLFLDQVNKSNVDGGIISFISTDPNPKFCYLQVENQLITELAEKKKISDLFAMGIFYFRKGSDFVQYYKKMIIDQETTNGEYYIAPIFSRMIEDGKKILNFPCDVFYSTGTIESLEAIPKGALREKY